MKLPRTDVVAIFVHVSSTLAVDCCAIHRLRFSMKSWLCKIDHRVLRLTGRSSLDGTQAVALATLVSAGMAVSARWPVAEDPLELVERSPMMVGLPAVRGGGGRTRAGHSGEEASAAATAIVLVCFWRRRSSCPVPALASGPYSSKKATRSTCSSSPQRSGLIPALCLFERLLRDCTHSLFDCSLAYRPVSWPSPPALNSRLPDCDKEWMNAEQSDKGNRWLSAEC